MAGQQVLHNQVKICEQIALGRFRTQRVACRMCFPCVPCRLLEILVPARVRFPALGCRATGFLGLPEKSEIACLAVGILSLLQLVASIGWRVRGPRGVWPGAWMPYFGVVHVGLYLT